jgi:hypothetical protein
MSAWLAFRASYSPLLTSSWQVFPTALEALLQDEDDARLQ